MTTEASFEMHAGDTKTLLITIVDEDGAAANLTGAALRYVMARGANPLVVKTTSGGEITIAANVATVPLLAADTAPLDGMYFHEMELIQGSDKATVLTGTVTISPTVG